MKIILVTIAILSTHIFAQNQDPITSVESGSVMLSIDRLHCTLFSGVDSELPIEDRLYTILGSPDSNSRQLGIIDPRGVKIELKHKFAQSPGCLVEELDRLKQDSHMRYGFIDSKVKLTKRSSGPFINGFGQCVERFHEKLELQISPNVSIESIEGKIKKASGC